MTTRSRARLFVMPVLVLLVAGGLTVMTQRRDTRRLAVLEQAVGAWCETAARGEDPQLPVAPAMLTARVRDALGAACRAAGAPTAWSITVDRGPGPAPAGSATHHAVVRAGGADRLGLQLTCHNDQPLIVGYWLE